MRHCPRWPVARARLQTFLAFVLLAGVACSDRHEDTAAGGRAAPTKPSKSEQRQFDDLTIRFAMQGPGLIGTSPSAVAWSSDGKKIFFNWNPPNRLDSLNAINPDDAYDNYLKVRDDAGSYAYDVTTAATSRLGEDAAEALIPDEMSWNRDRTRCAQIRDGDLYLVGVEESTTRRVTATLAREARAQISPDGDTAYFTREDNLFSVPWNGGPIRQLTDIRLESEPREDDSSDQRRYLLDQQKELFEEFQREDEDEGEDEARIRPIYLGDGWEIDGFLVSPSGRYAALEISSDAEDARRPVISHFVTESGYATTTETRAKVGDLRGAIEIRLIDLDGDSLLTTKADESMAMSARSWSPREDILLVRGIDARYKRRVFYAVRPADVDPENKVNMRVLDEYNDAAWVGGPNFYQTGAWLRDGSGIYFVSEESGYSHLFTVSSDGASRKRLADGRWEVHRARQSIDGRRWFLLTNEGDAGSRRVWVMDRDGSNRRVLTERIGGYVPYFSPDDKHVAVLHSTLNEPPELYVLDVPAETLNGPITRSTTELFRTYAWIWPPTIRIDASDGGVIRAHIFRPGDFGKPANKGGVIFVHGSGYLQNVASRWSYYYREYMFNHFLATQGYTVLNIDYRGSAGYGRESRVAIHKHMGGRDLEDVVDAARYLVQSEGVERGKVGVYGGSYGGFLTIMALFKYPEVFRAGGAIRSVTDWAHYNQWYTSRILGTPTEDPEAYRRSSPVYFAGGFEGGLLMLHGLVDSNVLAQDVLRLSQILIDLGKQDWDLVLYPLEDHAFERASSWADEYRRIYDLYEERLLDR